MNVVSLPWCANIPSWVWNRRSGCFHWLSVIYIVFTYIRYVQVLTLLVFTSPCSAISTAQTLPPYYIIKLVDDDASFCDILGSPSQIGANKEASFIFINANSPLWGSFRFLGCCQQYLHSFILVDHCISDAANSLEERDYCKSCLFSFQRSDIYPKSSARPGY